MYTPAHSLLLDSSVSHCELEEVAATCDALSNSSIEVSFDELIVE